MGASPKATENAITNTHSGTNTEQSCVAGTSVQASHRLEEGGHGDEEEEEAYDDDDENLGYEVDNENSRKDEQASATEEKGDYSSPRDREGECWLSDGDSQSEKYLNSAMSHPLSLETRMTYPFTNQQLIILLI